MREPTPEERQRDADAAAALRASEIRQAQQDREDRFAAFLGGRQVYARCKFHDWVYAADPAVAKRQRVVTAAATEFASLVDVHRKVGTGCLFFGPPGTGKDHLATCIIRAACLNFGQTARYVNGVEWFVALRDSMDSDKRTEGDIVREVTRPDWVVLSDPLPPGSDALSSYQSQMLYRLVDERAVQGKPTIVTVNTPDGEDAARRMGAATWDRLKSGAWVFPCYWPSFRTPARVI